MEDTKDDPPILSPDEQRTVLANERTRMAAERTFLSWLRTGLTSIAGGLVVARLIAFNTIVHQRIAEWIGGLLIIWGIAIFIFAFSNYQDFCKTLRLATNYKKFYRRVLFAVSSLVILGLILFWIIIG